ncbi:MAG: glutaredoxin family protein [Thermomicrobiales bacterium]|nr:glutaredoxin family protein [Thermomicrobiales bacterium]
MSFGSSYSPYGRWQAPPAIPAVVYGTRWCAQSQMVRRYLERLGVPYEYVDLERDPEAVRRLRWLTGGEARHPTVCIGGEWLVEPTTGELRWALARSGLR